ncbi:hypothetical protein [Clostridium culturomicium]|uniref:hypothetical protein n=1 Tax=Clostridium culturomicium TaxID=1499683 RepID=UPI00058F94E3|nr:hypothetical protein [Clostridium culturomicium]
MRNHCEKPSLYWLLSIFKVIFSLIFIGAFITAFYYIYIRYPLLFERLMKLWPIGMLILGVVLQYLYFETKFSIFLFPAGFFFVFGIMFNINLHNSFFNETMGLPIILIALAGSLLNYYTFNRRNVLLLPFILILIISSILLLLTPLYTAYINSSSLYLYLILIVIISTFSLIKAKTK